MEPDTQAQLKEILALTRENNEYLRVINSRERTRTILRVFYWTLIIGATVGSYYLIQPLINTYLGSTSSLLNSLQSIQKAGTSLPNSEDIQKAIQNFKIPGTQ